PFLPTITKITTISVGQHALVQQQSIVQDATNSKRYTVTLSATNTSPLELTSTTLAFNLSTNNFELIEANGAVVGANQSVTLNSTVYNYQNVKWTIGTIPVGETRTVTFIIEAKTGLGIGEQNIYHLTNTSYPILAVQYNNQASTTNYGYLKAPINWSDSNTATCPIPTIPTPSLTTNKVAVNSATSREYDITLSIDGNETTTPDKEVDIVLLLDRSGSMYTSAAQLNVAVENFLDDVLIDGQTNVRIALTSFGSIGNIHTGFTSDKAELQKDLAAIPFLENGEVLVTPSGYTSVNSTNTTYTVSPPFKENGIDYANITYGGKTYKRLVYTNDNGDLVLNLSANTATGETELPNRGNFFAYTNTEAGLIKVDEVLKTIADPCREKYVIIFSDGEPNFYIGDDGKIVSNTGASARVTATQHAKSMYEIIERKYQNLHTYSAGFFTGDSNGLGFDFMSYIQSKVQKPYDYFLNNFTTTADKLEPIFQGIAADLKGNIYYDIAKNIVVRDIVTEQFVLAANPNYRYSGL
ncbi:MAG: VWA domain-containing protein, partial [Culicoidibacterales bacterium]